MFDRLRARLRRTFRVRHVPFDGFTLVGYRKDIPKGMIHMLLYGDYEAPERRAVKDVVRPGDRVVDIGACMGVVSLTAARIAGAGNVVAFEPNPQAATVAADNFALNHCPIAIEAAAVGARAGTATLAVGNGSWLGAAIGGSYNNLIQVSVWSIGDVIARYAPTILIMDAEGMEVEILPACPMEGLRALVVEFHETPGRPEVIGGLRRLLSERGFFRNAKLSTTGELVCTEVWTREAAPVPG